VEVDRLAPTRVAEAIGETFGDQSRLAGGERERPADSPSKAQNGKAERPEHENEYDYGDKRGYWNQDAFLTQPSFSLSREGYNRARL
jgi:hypothetical protein